MNVPQETKEKYFNADVDKVLIVNFPDLNLTVDMEHIIYETMTLKESILENNSIEFVGCVASEFSVSLYGVRNDLKGQRVVVSIQAGNTDPIRLFYGVVDSVEMEANHNRRKITAYDMLYTIGNVEVADWYNTLPFPKNGIRLGDLRDSLFSYINSKLPLHLRVPQAFATLPCDSIKVKKLYKPTTLQSINVIKALCQINGVFGMVNRFGTFEYRSLTTTGTDEGTYPSDELYPPFYVGIQHTGDRPSQYIPYYRNIDYQEFMVKPVDKLTIRQSDDSKGYTYDPTGQGENNYIIQGNMFTYKLSEDVLKRIATSIYPNICGFSYQPFDSESDGLPWLECGLDNVSYYLYDYEEEDYVERKYTILSRTLTGIQALKDSYVADGERDQKQFISDIRSQIDVLKRKTDEIKDDIDTDLEDYYDKDEIDDMFENLPQGWSVESVEELPPQGQDQVLYLIQGEVVVE